MLKDSLRGILFRYFSLTSYVSDLSISMIRYLQKQFKGLYCLSLCIVYCVSEAMVTDSSMVKGICSIESLPTY